MCTSLFKRTLKLNGYIAQWLERLTADQQVPGSNPGVPFALEASVLAETTVWHAVGSHTINRRGRQGRAMILGAQRNHQEKNQKRKSDNASLKMLLCELP